LFLFLPILATVLPIVALLFSFEFFRLFIYESGDLKGFDLARPRLLIPRKLSPLLVKVHTRPSMSCRLTT
jgi:hypothetical protein